MSQGFQVQKTWLLEASTTPYTITLDANRGETVVIELVDDTAQIYWSFTDTLASVEIFDAAPDAMTNIGYSMPRVPGIRLHRDRSTSLTVKATSASTNVVVMQGIAKND